MFQLAEPINEFFHLYNCSFLCSQVSSGAGGQEAMLFAQEMFNMYMLHCRNNGWSFEVTEEDIDPVFGELVELSITGNLLSNFT